MLGLGIKRKVDDFAFRYFPRLSRKIFKKPLEYNKKDLLEVLPDRHVILEIGAHIGTDTIEFRKVFPNAVIHAFEPLPSNFKKLVYRTKDLKIHCHQISLGSKNGKTKFFVSSEVSDPASSSLKHPTRHLEVFPKIKFEKEIEVNVKRLEDWLAENSIDRVDFLWMDTQGNELDILQNSGKILQSIKAIHLEVSLVELYESAPLYPKVKEYFKKNNFYVYDETRTQFNYKNVVFVKIGSK